MCELRFCGAIVTVPVKARVLFIFDYDIVHRFLKIKLFLDVKHSFYSFLFTW